MTVNVDNTIGELPIGYRPLTLAIARNYGVDGYLMITETGSVKLHPSASNEYMSATFTYIVA